MFVLGKAPRNKIPAEKGASIMTTRSSLKIIGNNDAFSTEFTKDRSLTPKQCDISSSDMQDSRRPHRDVYIESNCRNNESVG